MRMIHALQWNRKIMAPMAILHRGAFCTYIYQNLVQCTVTLRSKVQPKLLRWLSCQTLAGIRAKIYGAVNGYLKFPKGKALGHLRLLKFKFHSSLISFHLI